MSQLKKSILILGASSFLTKPLIKKLEENDFYKIICQSRSNLRHVLNTKSDIKFLEINYEDKQYDCEIFKNCSYIINFVNASELNKYEILNFRRFIKHVLSISKASLIHISSASVYGNCKNKVISEIMECSPKNKYQRNKLKDEIELQKIANHLSIQIFILRPTELICNKSFNGIKFIESYKSASKIKRYIIRSLYGKRLSHFVSSKYLIENIKEIVYEDIKPGIYLVSQDNEELNSFYEIFEILDFKLNKYSKKSNFKIYLPIHFFFLILYKIFRSSQIPPFSRFISNNPIIDPKDYLHFKKDFLEHIDYILEKLKKTNE